MDSIAFALRLQWRAINSCLRVLNTRQIVISAEKRDQEKKREKEKEGEKPSPFPFMSPHWYILFLPTLPLSSLKTFNFILSPDGWSEKQRCKNTRKTDEKRFSLAQQSHVERIVINFRSRAPSGLRNSAKDQFLPIRALFRNLPFSLRYALTISAR